MIGKIGKPSPLVIKTLVVVVFFVVATISYNAYKDNIVVGDNVLRPTLISVDNTQNNVDTDGDTLFDWEEALWGTDINDVDTDGDGTTDGVEIALGRNPKVSAPNDLIETIEDEEDLNIPEYITDPDSYTSQVGVNIITRILDASQDGNIDQNLIVQEIQKEAENIILVEDFYSQNNVFIIDGGDDEIREYANDFVVAFFSEVEQQGEDLPQNQEELNQKLVELYEGVEKNLSVVEVPEVLSNSHINLLNSLYKINHYYDFVSQELTDPILAYMAAPKFTEEVENQNRILEQILTYIENSGIIFEEEDPAYELFN